MPYIKFKYIVHQTSPTYRPILLTNWCSTLHGADCRVSAAALLDWCMFHPNQIGTFSKGRLPTHIKNMSYTYEKQISETHVSYT